MRRFFGFIKNVLAGNTIVRITFGFSVFLLAQAWIYPGAFQVPVSINGRLFVMQHAKTVGAVLKQAGYGAGKGNLLDVDGRMFKRGGGTAAKIKINGQVSNNQDSVARGDTIVFEPGQDRIEPTLTVTETVVLVARVTGAGEYIIVKSPGRPGKKLVARGALSGKIISARTLSRARPMIVERTDIRPEKVIALTFDDGPNPPFTGQIFKILKDAQATATFFMLGRQVALYPKPVKKVHKAGFQIGNHSFSHQPLGSALEDDVIRELDNTRNLLFPLINVEPNWFRPPYGSQGEPLKAVAAEKNYRVVLWNIDSRDWDAGNSEDIVNNVLSGAFPGAIILMHDGGGNRTNTVMALPEIIQGLREQGYTFVTLDQLVE